jgi:hypothetical protein
MVSSYERRKLMRDFRREPACALALILKCVAGLLIIAGVALIGAQSDLSGDVATERLQAQRHDSASLAHSRRLYEERRARFESRQNAAGAVMRSSLSNPANAASAPRTETRSETLPRASDKRS